MTCTLAFDVYGTLINPHGLLDELKPLAGTQAVAFSQLWRDKQLEYAFRRGLMAQYAPFSVCTRDALAYCCVHFGIDIRPVEQQKLMSLYAQLPAFSDVSEGLSQLKTRQCRSFAFSNGTQQAVNEVLQHAGIEQHLHGIVSVDDVKSFKPNPAVYQHFLQQTQATAQQTWLISSNPFDVLGALAAGMHAVWLKRSQSAVFDPWGAQPDAVIESLLELVNVLPLN